MNIKVLISCIFLFSVGFLTGGLNSTCKEGHFFYRDNIQEYVEFSVKCKCGNIIKTGIPVMDKLWPLKYSCGQCSMKYAIYRSYWRTDARQE